MGARVTLLEDEDGLVLVDAGSAGSHALISAGLRNAGYTMGDVRLVVATHCHPDHSGGLAQLTRMSIPVAAHEDDAPIISREKDYPNPIRNPALATVASPLIRTLAGEGAPVTHRLRDGDTLPTMDGVKVVHTPGHTAGSICLFLESKRLLVAGDALEHRRGTLGPPARHVTSDFDMAVRSLGKLAALDVETICFGHFRPLRQGARESLRRLVLDYNRPG